MALEPITRQEKIIAGQDLTPITRMEKFLKQYGGGGGGSVPKPLTYDYMPEGYPAKAMVTVTLMEEQAVAFSDMGGGIYGNTVLVEISLVKGQTYKVKWDGTEYECVCVNINSRLVIGNASLMGAGEDTGEPFLYAIGVFGTLDTSPSHTISVKTIQEVVTPMAEKFLPATVAEIKETANNAQTTADNAQTTADNAQTTADNAQTTADNAQTTADNALPAYGTSYIRPTKDSSILSTRIKFVGDSNRPSIAIENPNITHGSELFASMDTISIGTLSNSNLSHCLLSTRDGKVSKLVLTGSDGLGTTLYSNGKITHPNGVDINLIKTSGIIFSSSTADSTKKFKITVDDSGTISATEVT